jgi:hypothetical protein
MEYRGGKIVEEVGVGEKAGGERWFGLASSFQAASHSERSTIL